MNILEHPAAFVFCPEEGGSRLLWHLTNYLHVVVEQNTLVLVSVTMSTAGLKYIIVLSRKKNWNLRFQVFFTRYYQLNP